MVDLTNNAAGLDPSLSGNWSMTNGECGYDQVGYKVVPRQSQVCSYGYGSIPINTIFRGMNIHLPAILMFTRGTRFWHTAIYTNLIVEISNTNPTNPTTNLTNCGAPPCEYIYIYIKGDTVFIPLLRVTIPHSKESLTVMDDNRLYPIYTYIYCYES